MKQVRINLQELIEKRGISQRELARRINVRQPSVNEWCNNETKRLPLDMLANICEVLGVGICDILELKDVKTKQKP